MHARVSSDDFATDRLLCGRTHDDLIGGWRQALHSAHQRASRLRPSRIHLSLSLTDAFCYVQYVELETLLETLVSGQPRSDRRRPTLDRDAWDASEESETATNADL